MLGLWKCEALHLVKAGRPLSKSTDIAEHQRDHEAEGRASRANWHDGEACKSLQGEEASIELTKAFLNPPTSAGLEAVEEKTYLR